MQNILIIPVLRATLFLTGYAFTFMTIITVSIRTAIKAFDYFILGKTEENLLRKYLEMQQCQDIKQKSSIARRIIKQFDEQQFANLFSNFDSYKLFFHNTKTEKEKSYNEFFHANFNQLKLGRLSFIFFNNLDLSKAPTIDSLKPSKIYSKEACTINAQYILELCKEEKLLLKKKNALTEAEQTRLTDIQDFFGKFATAKIPDIFKETIATINLGKRTIRLTKNEHAKIQKQLEKHKLTLEKIKIVTSYKQLFLGSFNNVFTSIVSFIDMLNAPLHHLLFIMTASSLSIYIGLTQPLTLLIGVSIFFAASTLVSVILKTIYDVYAEFVQITVKQEITKEILDQECLFHNKQLLNDKDSDSTLNLSPNRKKRFVPAFARALGITLIERSGDIMNVTIKTGERILAGSLFCRDFEQLTSGFFMLKDYHNLLLLLNNMARASYIMLGSKSVITFSSKYFSNYVDSEKVVTDNLKLTEKVYARANKLVKYDTLEQLDKLLFQKKNDAFERGSYYTHDYKIDKFSNRFFSATTNIISKYLRPHKNFLNQIFYSQENTSSPTPYIKNSQIQAEIILNNIDISSGEIEDFFVKNPKSVGIYDIKQTTDINLYCFDL